jgi:DNA polymerase-3 subunit epsilon
MADLREVVLDTETTGLDYKQGDRIIEIGCIELINKVKTDRFFHAYINPKRKVNSAAFNVHGISNEFLEDKPLFSDVAKDFAEFIKDATLVIHNAKFDVGFINHEFFLVGMPKISISGVIDTLLIARKKYPGSPANLNALCKRFNISLDKRDKHGALIDSELLAMVYVELTGGIQSKIDFQKAALEMSNRHQKRIDFPARTFGATKLEEAAHQELIKNIKNPLWSKSN